MKVEKKNMDGYLKLMKDDFHHPVFVAARPFQLYRVLYILSVQCQHASMPNFPGGDPGMTQ